MFLFGKDPAQEARLLALGNHRDLKRLQRQEAEVSAKIKSSLRSGHAAQAQSYAQQLMMVRNNIRLLNDFAIKTEKTKFAISQNKQTTQMATVLDSVTRLMTSNKKTTDLAGIADRYADALDDFEMSQQDVAALADDSTVADGDDIQDILEPFREEMLMSLPRARVVSPQSAESSSEKSKNSRKL
jgi:glycerol-3-phosphate cytidylyltransferase-like family protein